MIYVKNSTTNLSGEKRASRGFEYLIVSEEGDVERTLLEESGYPSFPDVLQTVTAIKEAVTQRRYSIERDPDINMYGFVIYGRDQNTALAYQFGWQSQEEVREFMRELEVALQKGPKVL